MAWMGEGNESEGIKRRQAGFERTSSTRLMLNIWCLTVNASASTFAEGACCMDRGNVQDLKSHSPRRPPQKMS